MTQTEAESVLTMGDTGLWLDDFAGLLGFRWIAKKMHWNIPPSYFYAIIMIVIPIPWSAAYKIWIGVPTVYSINPYFILQPILLLGAVWGAHTLKQDYNKAVEHMRVTERTSNPNPLVNIVPDRLPWALFLIAAAIQFLPGIKDTTGWVLADYVFNYFIFPFVYTPIIVQFFTVYLSVEFVAPWRLARSDIGIDFLDPQGVGGLRPFGELIKKAYYFIVVGLIGYSLITYAPFVSSWVVEGTEITNIIFTGVWVVSIATVAFAVLVLHRFMHREKREEIKRLENKYRDHIENPWDVKQYEIPEGNEETVTDLEDRIARVNQTSEYPATFSIWSQLLISAAIPKVLQLLIIA